MPRCFVLGAEQGRERVDRVLARLCPEFSRSTIQRWIAEGRVLLNGGPCRARDVVEAGTSLVLNEGVALPSRAEPDPSVPIEVLFEDDHLVVVNKAPGMVVHPARGHRTGTLVNGLLARPGFRRPPADPRDPEGAMRPGIVHRIDRDTSGVLVVAKSERAREGLKAQLASHAIERVYRALTAGVPVEGTVDTLHGRHPKSRLKFSTFVREGRRATTHVRLVEVLAGGSAALVECRLSTGRTHQIRVHLAECLQTPVLGDELYGGRRPDMCPVLGRQALHAMVLGFVHPLSGESMRFEAPWPSDLQRALTALRLRGTR